MSYHKQETHGNAVFFWRLAILVVHAAGCGPDPGEQGKKRRVGTDWGIRKTRINWNTNLVIPVHFGVVSALRVSYR